MTESQQEVERQLTAALAFWGAASVLVGGVVWGAGSSDRWIAFGRQTAAWGAIDLVIAGVGTMRSRRRAGPPSHEDRGRLHRVLVVNSVLDVGYVAAGTALAVRSDAVAESITRRMPGRRYGAAELRGDGAAIVVQGLFLLGLDTMFAVRTRG